MKGAPRKGRAGLAFAVVGCLLVAYVVFVFDRSAGRVAEAQEQQVVEHALTEVSDPLAALCAENSAIKARVGPACDTAALVVAAPVGQPADGLPGANGADGRGITSTWLRADGHLLITYSDGSQTDVGQVIGEAGTDGADGRGITFSQVIEGRLILAFSDGTTVDVGRIVGDPGRGVESTAVVDGRLIVSYDDGTTQDAGELPRGPAGVNEPASQLEFNQPDGTKLVCPRTGGTDDAPVYTCDEIEESQPE